MAECPNPEYAKYIRTTSGLTLEEPTGAIATGWDYGEWFALAGKMRHRMEASWRKVLAGMEAKYPADWALKVASMQRVVGEIRTRQNNLLKPWDFFDFTQVGTQISDATSVVHDLVCMWQKVDEFAEANGVETEDRPLVIGEKGGPSVLAYVIGVPLAFGAGYGIFQLVKRAGR